MTDKPWHKALAIAEGASLQTTSAGVIGDIVNTLQGADNE